MKLKTLLVIGSLSLLLCACTEEQQNNIVDTIENEVAEGITNTINESTEELKNTAKEKVTEKANELLSNLGTTDTQSENNELIDVELVDCYDGDTCTFLAKSEYTIDSGNDTLSITDGQKIKSRFLLIDSKEIKSKENGKPEKWAVEAKDRTLELLTNAETISLVLDKGDKFDKYGRLLCYVYFNSDQTVQEVLLEEGLAEVKYIFNNQRYKDKFLEIQDEAQNKKVGLWSED
ncbi:TPA: thermonuclease family protein [Salmonella enterica subsp. enterica serovar Typhi str. AG3]|nr:thermonuclease family protein [Salmonella enterica subsp. enterica serovar Typhi str. AG3]